MEKHASTQTATGFAFRLRNEGRTNESGVSERLPRLILAVELGHEAFEEIVKRFGPQGWNDWIKRLIDSSNTMAVWQEGQIPPPVSVFFYFEKDVRPLWPDVDFQPIYFPGVDNSQPDHENQPDKNALPQQEFPLPNAKVSLLLDLS